MVDKCLCMMYNSCCTKAEAAESISTWGLTTPQWERGFRRRSFAAQTAAPGVVGNTHGTVTVTEMR